MTLISLVVGSCDQGSSLAPLSRALDPYRLVLGRIEEFSDYGEYLPPEQRSPDRLRWLLEVHRVARELSRDLRQLTNSSRPRLAGNATLAAF